MHTDLTTFFHRTQHHYLPPAEMAEFKKHIDLLRERLEVYECLREQELMIFQLIADQIEEIFIDTEPRVLTKCLKHWISILRYCAMAMLLNNPEYLQHRLLEWLTDIVQAHDTTKVDQEICQLLQVQLAEMFSGAKLGLINAFIEQTKATIFVNAHNPENNAEAMA